MLRQKKSKTNSSTKTKKWAVVKYCFCFVLSTKKVRATVSVAPNLNPFEHLSRSIRIAICSKWEDSRHRLGSVTSIRLSMVCL